MKKKHEGKKQKESFLEKINAFIGKRDTLLFWIIFAVTAIVSTILFDPKISVGGDDSGYIISANEFARNFTFPGFQGALYPIVLSLFVLIFGIAPVPLKIFSLLSMLGFIYMSYITFRKIIPAFLLFSGLLLISINSYVLYFASQTYTEAFYMFIQTVVFYLFIRFFIEEEAVLKPVNHVKRHLWLALAVLCAILTKNIAFYMVIGISGYFLLYKRWKDVLLFAGSFIAVFFIFWGIKALVWGGLPFGTSQLDSLLRKDFYQPEFGYEDLKGMFGRLCDNSVTYLSGRTFLMLGLGAKVSNFFTILMYIIAIGALFLSYKKNKAIFFAGLMSGVFLMSSFIILQTMWNQYRLIVPSFFYVVIVSMSFFYYLFSVKFRALQIIIPLLTVILFFTVLEDTITTIKKNKETGNAYTPDWENFLNASRWVGENLKADEKAASRKPEMSSIYANGKPFKRISSIPAGDTDLFLKEWQEQPDKYIAVPASDDYEMLYPYYKASIQIDKANSYKIIHNVDSVYTKLTQQNIPVFTFSNVWDVKTKGAQISVFYADTLLNNLRKDNVTHIMIGSLRANPEENNGNIISTVLLYVYYIAEKYPYLFFPVHQEGIQEPTTVYRINWEMIR